MSQRSPRRHLSNSSLFFLSLLVVCSEIDAQQLVETTGKIRSRVEDQENNNDNNNDNNNNTTQPPVPIDPNPISFVDPNPISYVGPPGSDYVFQNPPSEGYRFPDPEDACAGDGTPRNCRDTQKDCCPNPNDPTQYICCVPPSDNGRQGSGGGTRGSGGNQRG